MPRQRLFRFPWRTAAQVAADVDEELDFHLELMAQELVDEGWPPEGARAEAVRRFGDLEGTRRVCRSLDTRKETQMKWTESLGDFGQDLRFGGRQLAKSPGFTLVAILTLALGIGATISVFSVVYGVVLRSLPWTEPERLVRPLFVSPEGEEHGAFSAPNFVDLRAQSRTLSGLAGVNGGTLNLSGLGAEPERLPAAHVTANYFDVLGVRPLAGRTFAADEDRPGAPRVAVISEELWGRRFGRDPKVIGQSLTLSGQPYTVVGVLARGTQLPSGADVWVPLVFSEQDLRQRGAVYFAAIGRLAPGVSWEQARAELEVIARRLAQQYPDANAGYMKGMTLQSLQENMTSDTRKPLLILLGAVASVLLIACVNVANLLLVRAAAREGEIVIRAALGAGRARIVRQLLTESLVLSLAGGAAGVALAAWVTKMLVKLAPREIPRLEEIGLDGTILLFALGLSLLTGLLFGLAPALQTSRTDLSGVIREGTRGSKGRAATRARGALVVLEMAMAVVLLAGAGLLIRSFARLQQVDPGFNPKGVVTFNLELPASKYSDDAKLRTFMAGLLERLEQLPGVSSAGATVYGMPLDDQVNVLTFSVAGRPPAPPGKEDSMRIANATPDYFRTLGIRIVRGRGFTPQDRDGAPQVVVITEEAARRFFPHEEPLGKRIDLGWTVDDVPRGGEVVGIAADFKQETLSQKSEPQLYLPYDQAPLESLAVVLRSDRDPQVVAAAAKEKVRELDPDLPIYGLQSMADVVAKSTAQSRFYMLLLGGFAVISLVLAAIGIYGVIAYAVRQRTQEIGIRMALGATGERVTRMVVSQGIVLAGVGAVVGLAAALLATRGMQSLLFEVKASDPTIYVGVAAVLVAVAAFASYLPARRAARTDPQLALRGEV
ncbi:MAG TPA: ABC transporter permease [Thermoanaerobaculia bacterium]|jgi:putative ABC transport system permease protein|nr:ABC transporter permease [Thermoanaerobaculia bacterium]